MIIQAEPFAVQQQMALGLSVGPGAPGEGGDRLAQGEVDALDEGGLDQRSQAHLAQAGEERAAFSPEHPGVGERDPPSVFALDQLTVKQVVAGLPVVATGARRTKPVTKMSGEGVEVTAQTVGSESGHTVRGEAHLQVVDKRESIFFGASTEMQGRNGFAGGGQGRTRASRR